MGGDARTLLPSAPPLVVEPKLPPYVRVGDRVTLPINVANSSPNELAVRLAIAAAHAGAEQETIADLDVALSAGERRRALVALPQVRVSGPVTLHITASAGRLDAPL